MTDRHSGFLVVLSKDIREDDAEPVLDAIRMIKGVQSVVPVVSDVGLRIAESRVNSEWTQMLYRVIHSATTHGPASVAQDGSRS